jgi:heme/copper-type cytochrome/quinol oxidase subunit 1
MAQTLTKNETPTDAPALPAGDALVEPLPLPGGLAGVLGSGDHATIGRLWVGFALLFGVAAAVAGVFADLARLSDLDFPPTETVTQFTYFRATATVFLFLVALAIGIGTYVVPLQVGSRTIAFPRLAAGAFWTWLLGSGVLITSFAINGGPEGGVVDAGEVGTSLFLVSFIVVLVALGLAAVCIMTTVFGLRTVGMSMMRVPMFSWSMVVAGAVWLLSFPVLAGMSLLILVDFEYGSRIGFGTPPEMWEKLGWFAGQPQIYVVAIPVLGVIADVIPTFSGTRTTFRGGIMAAIGAFGVLSFGAWAAPVVNPDVTTEAVFVIVSVLIVVPVLALLGGWASVMRKGSPSMGSPALLGLVAALLLLVATVAGAAYAIEPLEVQGVADGAWELGQMLLVTAAAASGLAAGVFYWAPKMWGHTASDSLGKLAAPLFLLAGFVAGVPQLLLGLSQQVDQLADAADALNGITAAGSAIGALAVVLVALGAISSARGTAAGDDPWGSGQTLEWATASPPPRGNFALLAPVVSAEPLLDAADGKEPS